MLWVGAKLQLPQVCGVTMAYFEGGRNGAEKDMHSSVTGEMVLGAGARD